MYYIYRFIRAIILILWGSIIFIGAFLTFYLVQVLYYVWYLKKSNLNFFGDWRCNRKLSYYYVSPLDYIADNKTYFKIEKEDGTQSYVEFIKMDYFILTQDNDDEFKFFRV